MSSINIEKEILDYSIQIQKSVKKIKKLRQEYGKEGILAMRILDYVRISIVAFLFIDTKKDTLVNMIDKTWISNKELQKFNKILLPPKKF